MDEKKEAAAQLVSTIDTDHVNSKESILDYQKPLILLNLNGLRRTRRMRR